MTPLFIEIECLEWYTTSLEVAVGENNIPKNPRYVVYRKILILLELVVFVLKMQGVPEA